MSKREDRHIVQVLVMDKWCRSGNCPDTYESKKEADRAIARKGIGYMTYRVKRVCGRVRRERAATGKGTK